MSTEYRGFTKRLSHGHSFSGTSIYDGVFAGGGSKKLGVSSRIEDYAEIFGGPRDSRRSSIPVLEFPGLHERKAQVDVRTSKLDYSKIFGGFGDSDGALTFEELANDKPSEGPVKRTRDGGQSTPELSVSGPTENQVLSREASNGSRDKPKRFNLSYSQVNIGSNDEINKRVHIAQLGDVPGYTCIIEETAPVTKAKGDKPQAPASNGYCNGDAGDGMLNDCEKATPGVSAMHTDKPSTKEDNSMHKSGQSRSFLNDPLFGMYEYGLRKETFGVQSPINLPNSPCTKVENRRVSPTSTSEDVAGVYSLPDFDEQVDANSIAATSAAAVKIAIEKAQAKIKVAKERMERRKEGLQGRVRSKEKFRSQDKGDVKGAEKISKFTGEEPQELCETDATAQLIAGTIEDYPVKSDSVTLESGYTENLSSSESFVGGIFQQACREIRAYFRLGKVREEADNFNEAAGTKERVSAAVEHKPESGMNDRIQSCDEHEDTTRTVESSFQKLEEVCKPSTASQEALNEKKPGEKLTEVEGAQECDEHMVNFCSPEELNHLEESIPAEEATKERGENRHDIFYDSQQCQENEKDWNSSEFERSFVDQKLEESSLRNGENSIWEENERKQIEAWRGQRSDRASYVCGWMSNCTLEKTSREEECKEGQEESFETMEHEGMAQETCNLKESTEEPDNSCLEADNENRLDTAYEQEKIQENLETCNLKENRDELNDLCLEVEDVNRLDTAHEQEKIKSLNDSADGKESNGLQGEIDLGENHEFARVNENEEIPEEAYQINASLIEQGTSNSIETEKLQGSIDMGAEDEANESQEALERQQNNIDAFDTCEGDTRIHLTGSLDSSKQDECDERVELTMGNLGNQKGEKMAETNSSIPHESGYDLRAVADDCDFEKISEVETVDLIWDTCEHSEVKQEVDDASEVLDSEDDDVNLGYVIINNGAQLDNQYTVISNCNEEEPEQGLAAGLDNDDNDLNEAEISINRKEEDEVSETQELDGDAGYSDDGGCAKYELNMEAKHLHDNVISKEKTVESQQGSETSQSTEKPEENHYTNQMMDESEGKDTFQKEIEMKKERCKSIDEAKEKEKEREKEKIAVERAIREARERAFAEARERAGRTAVEKATAEARQRVVEKAREKIGKTPTEANAKLTDRTSVEAKIKAERAAVERATAEARERALEKALAGKLGKEQKVGQRSQPHDPQHKGSHPSSSSRHSISSDPDVTGPGERSDVITGESAQRHKARLERHQRTAERAAKALAEKNKRDLLAQREQAEKNRLAESLDMDIKRWSSGKQGNLRALLSTLQYILGPDSGWQSVSLTEVVTTAAVKKAYRRATLCVHPDKLQQRGASLQQKYICEKVFDLLKEAWNKFSAEER